MEALRVLDLFSGGGQLGCAVRDGLREGLGVPSRTVAYCEFADYPQAVLLSRMRRGEIDTAPICTDIRELHGAELGRIDVIVGGWPCQGNSNAGRRKGMADERSGLVVEVIRLVRELGPSLVYLENVPGVLTAPGDGVGYVASALASLGYELRWTDLSAADVGQAHKRRRFWLMAYSPRHGALGNAGGVQPADGGPDAGLPRELERGGEELGVADTKHEGLPQSRPARQQELPAQGEGGLHHRLEQPSSCLGHDNSQRGRQERREPQRPSGHNGQSSETLDHGQRAGLEIRPSLTGHPGPEQPAAERGCLPMVPPGRHDDAGWAEVIGLRADVEPTLRRVAPRLAYRADRIRVIGNGVDYPTAKAAFKALLGR